MKVLNIKLNVCGEVQYETFEFIDDQNELKKISCNYTNSLLLTDSITKNRYDKFCEISNIFIKELLTMMNIYNIKSIHLYENKQMLVFNMNNSPNFICNAALIKGLKLHYNCASVILDEITRIHNE